MKRFTATEKWDDVWFRTLSPHLKLLWLYLCDKCDHAGVWNPDLDHAAYLIGSGKFCQEEALKAFGDRVTVLGNGRWFLRKFVPFQYGQLKSANNCHQSVLRRLKELGIEPLAYPSPTLGQPINPPSGRGKDKDKDKDKVQEEEKERGDARGGLDYYHADARSVLALLNEGCGKHFREVDANLAVISARLREPEVTFEGIRAMINRQCRRWKGTAQEDYLRPETLFGKTKFDSYYAARENPINENLNGKGFDRNKGTFNEGKAHLYVPKFVPTPKI